MAFQFNFFFNEDKETVQKVKQDKGNYDTLNSVPLLEQNENVQPTFSTGCCPEATSVGLFCEDGGNRELPVSCFLSSEEVECGKTGVLFWSKREQDLNEKSDGIHRPKTAVPVSLVNENALAREHIVPSDTNELFGNKTVRTLHVGSTFSVHYIDVSVLEKAISSEAIGGDVLPISRAISVHSDLISGVYEGGMKVWECTFDLIAYLLENQVQFVGKKILDLGCGAGLLGIVALKHHAKEVHFQDYNATVIEALTMPNVLLNIEDCCSGRESKIKSGTPQFVSPLQKNYKLHPKCTVTEDREDTVTVVAKQDDHPSPKRRKVAAVEQKNSPPSCRFFSGEWSSVLGLLSNTTNLSAKYDIIITSETIYNVDYYPVLHDVLSHLLSEKGVVYVAGKTHYFGVGGGIHLFESFVEEKSIFSVKTAKVIDEGLNRVILALTFKMTC